MPRAPSAETFAPPLREGAVIDRRYRLDRLIGEGGMGTVWAATHLTTRGTAAIKFLKAADAELARRLLREARIAGTIRHPNVVTVHDVLELVDGTPAMVMEHLQGESLAHRLARDGALAVDEAARILLPVVSAVGFAHSLGIVHRDLKPDNVFLVEESGASCARVKVLDFGIAKLTASEGDLAPTTSLTRTGALLGTPYYMSPEQVYGHQDLDHRTDLWALGVLLYQVLSGVRPFGGDNFGQLIYAITVKPIVPLSERRPGLPPALTAMVGGLLQRDRDRRPPDLSGLFDLLAAHVSQDRTAEPREPLPPRPAPIQRPVEAPGARPWRRRAALAVGGLLLVASAAWIGWRPRPRPAPPPPRPAALVRPAASLPANAAAAPDAGPAVAGAPSSQTPLVRHPSSVKHGGAAALKPARPPRPRPPHRGLHEDSPY
ncbi:MAG TPA: serine/threonine-protein kinase [Polyangia bacterium]|jgi:serine/threonine-protein kinase